jgi:hypothetical protein
MERAVRGGARGIVIVIDDDAGAISSSSSPGGRERESTATGAVDWMRERERKERG